MMTSCDSNQNIYVSSGYIWTSEVETMTEQVLVTCRECGKAYSARKCDDSRLILPTCDAECACGNETFVEVDPEEEVLSG